MTGNISAGHWLREAINLPRAFAGPQTIVFGGPFLEQHPT